MSHSQTETHRPGGTRFRADIEGMRALAVIVVLLHHAGLAYPSGGFAGVDIFFVVSGFVITTQLLRELDRDGRVSLMTFYGRRAKRLLPAAGIVLIFTTVAAWLMVSRVQWSAIATDIVGASLYVVNWVFAERSVDYLAEDVNPSPVLHFWSLAVEEQFYVVWPLVILALVWLARRRTGPDGGPPSRTLLALGMTVLIVVPSLIWAMYLTQANPERAFFVTPTRLWELGIGALVSIGAGLWIRLAPRPASIIAWAGLVVVLAGALLQDTSSAWPWPGALVPVIGTAAVIVGGFSADSWGPRAVLGLPVLVWIGGLSYSLYLWHWPVLAIARWQLGELSVVVGLLCVIGSVIPAWVVNRLVETPIRYSTALNRSPRFALSVGFNCTLAALVAGLILSAAATSGGAAGGLAAGGTTMSGDESELSEPTADIEPPGAQAYRDSPVYDVLTPDPVLAPEDVPELYAQGCQVAPPDTEPVLCEAGDPDGEVVLAVVGDSKIAQWIPAVDEIAQANGWKVISYTKSACAPSTAMLLTGSEPYEACSEWSENVLERLAQDPPDVYLTSGRRSEAGPDSDSQSADNLIQGYADYWQQVSDLGIRVVVMGDSAPPRLEDDEPVYECVADHPDDFDTVCTWDYVPSAALPVLEAAADEVEGADFFDLDPWVCPQGTCYGVYRNIVAFRQGSHLTETFVRFLAPALAQQLVPLVQDATAST